jgi:hypothetical protein
MLIPGELPDECRIPGRNGSPNRLSAGVDQFDDNNHGTFLTSFFSHLVFLSISDVS